MVRIVTDSSALYTQEEAKELGFAASPLSIVIDEWQGEDLQMDMDRFYGMIQEGKIPQSSQPAIGIVMDAYEAYPEDDIINITMADGLSGTYQSACGVKTMVDNKEKITVFNSQTLCGPHRYMIQEAVKMAISGKTKEEILSFLEEVRDNTDSFLVPQDFSFLRRGGRLTPLAATFGSVLKLKPILRITPDGKRLDKHGVKRTVTSVAASIAKNLEQHKLDEKHILYICHANVLRDACKMKEVFMEKFPKVEIQMLELSPAFVTQGGPGCIAIQYVKK
ncbi:MAG: DegV family protein [Eubacteriales bacterium]